MEVKVWKKTTLRKGTLNPRICRDMFITNSNGVFTFAEVKNGSISTKERLTECEARKLISDHSLVSMKTAFKGCYTYRDYESTALVMSLLSSVGITYENRND